MNLTVLQPVFNSLPKHKYHIYFDSKHHIYLFSTKLDNKSRTD